jgi:hypothetical protein
VGLGFASLFSISSRRARFDLDCKNTISLPCGKIRILHPGSLCGTPFALAACANFFLPASPNPPRDKPHFLLPL